MSVEENKMYLHGDFELIIIEARSLPERKIVSSISAVASAVSSAAPMWSFASPAPELPKPAPSRLWKIQFGSSISGYPWLTWFLSLTISYGKFTQVEFLVRDNTTLIAQVIGVATVPATRIASGEQIEEWFPVIISHGMPPVPEAAIRLRISFTPCNENPTYLRGISEDYELRESYFPLRHGGKVTLYQDAHVFDGTIPDIVLDEGRVFENGKCWEDICHAILEAQSLVYIIGWSIYHKVRLVREPTKPLPNGGDLTLGELLKRKSDEGVRVLLLVWDDPTSNDFFLRTKGLMKTHDEETRKFFKHSSVMCLLAPRFEHCLIYSHHQKCVIVDTQDHGVNRRITAFLGGLDLCNGRYDTPEHRLFRDLDTVLKDDLTCFTFFEQLDWEKRSNGQGPAAYDVLKNFEQRWKKVNEASRYLFKRLRHSYDDSLIDTEHDPWITCPSTSVPNDHPSLWVSKEDDPEHWHVQVFRTIDSGSLKGFPINAYAAEEQNLVWAKEMAVDRSIQMAYIQAIRSAQHFVYNENQYFVGSSFAWPFDVDSGADNLIPMELALKIASKIRAKERFTVYIVIPMWPEGRPGSPPVPDILCWQRQTMEMMYNVVAQEIKSAQLETAHPTDYLNFYCLGNREQYQEEGYSQTSSSGIAEPASQRFQRFMIYVHSKGIIVDDAYMIIGSANINERSMAGSRDTEIAMGAYQPHYTWAKKKGHPCGQIYGYRMSLWAEHIGSIHNCFKDPENLECVKYVNGVAEDNRKRYTAEQFTSLQGHIMKYPVEVDSDGNVKPLPGHEVFPDVGGEIQGFPSLLPRAVTT
ncbi:hypothetical protein DH2020_007970 [Rehmannia glutinosa]|uniref:Phospholipase D n=1 Tax=Rehmannia glutinosa TaxID=99300 RepID=A0ABR0TZM6_REHGL